MKEEILGPAPLVFLAPVTDRSPRFVPPERKRELERVRAKEILRQKNSVWALLEDALLFAGVHPEKVSFHRTDSGKYLADGFSFSLSHTPRLCAVALSSRPVGVDAEEEEPFFARCSSPERFKRLARRVAFPGESAPDPAAFLRLWTGKEAAFKAASEPVFRPASIPLAERPLFWRRVEKPCRAVIALCSENGANARFFFRGGEMEEITEKK